MLTLLPSGSIAELVKCSSPLVRPNRGPAGTLAPSGTWFLQPMNSTIAAANST
jgi:hypothetical protein